MSKIIDLINHENKYSTQTAVVLDKMPEFKYEKKGDLLIGEDSGFFSFYIYERPSKYSQAFAGRKFDIPLVGGDVIKATGQWWDHFPSDYYDLTYSYGVNTIKNLQECYVFFGGFHIDREIVDCWLKDNDPSNNYYKYDKGSKDYGKHKIVSKWDEKIV